MSTNSRQLTLLHLTPVVAEDIDRVHRCHHIHNDKGMQDFRLLLMPMQTVSEVLRIVDILFAQAKTACCFNLYAKGFGISASVTKMPGAVVQ